MLQVVIYTKNYCHFCQRAKQLLDSRNIAYEEIDITENDEMREKMVIKAGGKKTVPQIFIDGVHIGGCDDLYALEQEGMLDKMLKASQE
jgi:glutaredoxin 3